MEAAPALAPMSSASPIWRHAKALLPDEETTAYLAGLAAGMRRRRPRTPKEAVPSGVAKLVAGANRLRDVFLDHAEQALLPDWEFAIQGLIAGFRQAVGTDIDDPRFIELVGELSLASPRFRQLWARHDVRPLRGGSCASIILRWAGCS